MSLLLRPWRDVIGVMSMVWCHQCYDIGVVKSVITTPGN